MIIQFSNLGKTFLRDTVLLTAKELHPARGLPELVEVGEQVDLDDDVHFAADAVDRVVNGKPALHHGT